MCPKVSIITVVYNDVHNISRTVESIIGQSYSNLEYIVIDGDSVDGTKDVVKTYLSSIDVYISEDDNGIYDAMNKGVSLSSGDWILFMSSGDVFYNGDVVSNIFCTSIPLASSLIYGDTIFRYDEKDVLTTYNSKKYKKNSLYKYMPSCHQSIFCRREYLQRLQFDTRYHIAADFDFFYRLHKINSNYFYVPIIISIYDASQGLSSRNKLRCYKEIMKIKEPYYLYLLLVLLAYVKYIVKKYL